ncbi:APC family permease [Flavobacteriaceae bacterium]|nr:APC family permease [Flavobacteriaceae bacterium]
MKSSKVSLSGAISIGIGGMVGGGIFAVLGLAVEMAQGATPLAFLFAGIIAFITSYSYVKMSLTFPDRGGTVKFMNAAWGKTVFSGGLNNTLYLSYIIMLSLYASSFGSYAPNLIKIFGSTIDFHFFASIIILICALINYYSVHVVSAIEDYAVGIKLVILIGFVFIAGYGLIGNPNLEQLKPEYWSPMIQVISGGMVIFVAYEGFELIANTVPDMSNPLKNVPKAYYYSVGFVILLYIAISGVTVASIPFTEIAKAQEYVLAEAAKPVLGQLGFTIITIAALISTFSAINASLLGGTRVNYELAEDDELPHEFTAKLWNQPIGLLITTIMTLVLVNFMDLSSISTAGSIGFLIIFAMVNFANLKLRKATKSKSWIPLTGFLMCLVALAALINQQIEQAPNGVYIAILIILVCFLGEFLYKRSQK